MKLTYTKAHVIAAAVTLALTAGCMVGPNYVRPSAPSAPAFKEMGDWKPEQPSDAVSRGKWWEIFGDAKLNALIALVREATTNAGKVTDSTWKAAQHAAWTDQQLTDAFAYLGLTLFTGYFLNFAQTDLDV